MVLKKFILSLMLLVSVGLTVLQGQTASDSCLVELSCNEFDFYAQKLVEHEGLKADTTILSNQIRVYDQITRQRVKQLQEYTDIMANKNAIIDLRTKDYNDLSVKFNKSQKQNKALKQTSLTFVCISLVLGVLVLVK